MFRMLSPGAAAAAPASAPNLRTPLALWVPALLALAAGTAAAQDRPGAQTTTSGRTITPEQEQYIVRGERSLESTLPLELSRYGADLEIVTAEQIANHGFVDAAQSLETLVPGVYLTTRHGAFSYIDLSLQGSRSSDVLFTVDGVRINNRLYASTGPTDTLPSSMIQRMEVLKGGQGLMYGTQAIAGVVNVVTRGFSNTPEGSITVGTGSHDLLRFNGYRSGSVGDHRYVVWGSIDRADGYETYDAYQPTIPADDRDRGYDVQSRGIKYGYDFSDDLSLTLLGLRTEAKLDNTSVSSNPNNYREEDIFSLRLDYTPESGPQFFVKSYYHDWDTEWVEPGAVPEFWGYDDFGLSFSTLLAPGDNLEYQLGYDFQTYEGQDDVLLIAKQREDVHAVFGQIRSTDALFSDAAFSFGVRHDRTGGSDSTVWSATGIYHFNDYLYLQGVAGTTFMLPSAENLYRIHCPNPGVSTCTHGNPSLEPEESIGVNVSLGGRVDVAGRPMSWQVTTWDRRIDNLITTAPVDPAMPNPPPPEFSRTFVNVSDEVKATGYEFLFRGPITQALAFDVSYTYSKERTAAGAVRLDRPKRSHKASLSYAPPARRFGVDFAYKHVGELTQTVTGFGVQTYGDYYVANLGAHVLLDEQHRHRLGFRVENVFDKDYASTVGSAVVTGSSPAERFFWRRLGPPRSLHVSYTVGF